MKKILLLAFVFGALSAKAQGTVKADSAFYLLDTARTPASDRLWHTYAEGAAKFYELALYSSCSNMLDRPTFGYSGRFQKVETIGEARFRSIRRSSLSELLLHLKEFAAEDSRTKTKAKRKFYLYVIERQHKGYSMVRTELIGSGLTQTTE